MTTREALDILVVLYASAELSTAETHRAVGLGPKEAEALDRAIDELSKVYQREIDKANVEIEELDRHVGGI